MLSVTGLFAQQSYSIEDALRRNLVSITINGASIDKSKSGVSSHYGDCLQAQITNKTNTAFIIDIESGRLFPSFDTLVQTMLLTKSVKVKVEPKKSRRIKLFAMCSQKGKNSPSINSKFRVGQMAHDGLVALARFLEKRNCQNSLGQNAVWAITDDYDFRISKDETDLGKELYAFVLRIKSTLNTVSQTTKIQFDSEFKKQGLVSIKVFDSEGKIVKTLAQDIKSQLGYNKFEYWLNDVDFQEGKYKVILFFNGVAYAQREFEF